MAPCSYYSYSVRDAIPRILVWSIVYGVECMLHGIWYLGSYEYYGSRSLVPSIAVVLDISDTLQDDVDNYVAYQNL